MCVGNEELTRSVVCNTFIPSVMTFECNSCLISKNSLSKLIKDLINCPFSFIYVNILYQAGNPPINLTVLKTDCSQNRNVTTMSDKGMLGNH